MAPHAEVDTVLHILPKSAVASTRLTRQPLKYSGTLDDYSSFEHTPVIGTEFPELQVKDILNDDEKLRDLAILISRRGVVFFRNQELTVDQLKFLTGRLGELAGKPSDSKLHRHVMVNIQKDLALQLNGKFDDEVWVISSDIMRNHYPTRFVPLKPLASEEWHTDLAYEPTPSDYTSLHIVDTPSDGSGGDTLWASACEVYDRLSPAFKVLANSLSAVHNQARLVRVVQEHGIKVTNGNRGAPENTGSAFCATHPVVRTNPVTGWKSLYAAGVPLKEGHIEGVTKHESDMLKQYFNQLISQNHDLQVRFRWNKKDLAIWDNRSTFHVGTDDFEGRRHGNRVVSLGEKPYFDPLSTSRREALAAEEGRF